MRDILVTIVTPSLNQGRYIDATIKSVLNQTYRNFEYIIMDGGSIDNTHEIIKSYSKDRRLKFFCESDNGQYDAVNKAFKRAGGSILGWINADDVYMHDAISNIVEIFRTNLKAEVVYGRYRYCDENGKTIPFKPWIKNFSLKWLKRYDYVNPSATFLRAYVVKGGFYIRPISYFGDWDWYLRMAKAGIKFYYFNKNLCYFRLHKRSRILSMHRNELKHQRKIIGKLHSLDIRKNIIFEDYLFPMCSRIANVHHYVKSLFMTQEKNK